MRFIGESSFMAVAASVLLLSSLVIDVYNAMVRFDSDYCTRKMKCCSL